MKIAILNECFLSEDFLNRLRNLGDVIVFDNTRTEEEAIERLKDVDIAVVDGFLCPVTATILNGTDNLKLIVLPHTGYFMVDLEVANSKGIKIANCPGFSKQAVAEMVIGRWKYKEPVYFREIFGGVFIILSIVIFALK